MITYKKDQIFCYDNRDFIKYEYSNNINIFEKTKTKNTNKEKEENNKEEKLIKDMTNKNNLDEFELQTNTI